eukprot:TRINITY_DN90708_c0_g1_i1.p1 TRINITY_DN90708_c0_g1~~TRINITY_DN90708_c0_g1_i1.p1  ORF type:complete len:550 (-),score=75.26 TRINITY_DN90708_c0_g1_i1:253-1902(-)
MDSDGRPCTAPGLGLAEQYSLDTRPQTAGGPLGKHFSLEGEATPERLCRDKVFRNPDRRLLPTAERLEIQSDSQSKKVKLKKMHDELREQLMKAIRDRQHVQIKTLVTRGATLLPHYYSAKLPVQREVNLQVNSKGIRSGLVNPVDWAVLEGCYEEAMLLLELADGKVVFGRDEQQSFLSQLNLAQQCQQAVVIATTKNQMKLLHSLLERGANVTQQNIHGDTALSVAVRAGKLEVVDVLLNFGAWDAEPQKQLVLERAEAQHVLAVVKAAGALAHPGREERVEGRRPPWGRLVNDLALAGTEADKQFTLTCIADEVGSPIKSRPVSQSSPRSPRYQGEARLAGLEPQGHDLATEHQEVLVGPVGTWSQVRSDRHEEHANMVSAIRKGDVAKIAALVEHGAALDLTFALGYGETGNCVDWACACERPAAALLLLDLADKQGLGESLAIGSCAALFWSVLHGYLEVLRGLLARGADVGKQGPAGQFGASALTLAVSSFRPDEVRELLAYGAWDRESMQRRPELVRLVHDRTGYIAQAFVDAGIQLHEFAT